MCVACWFIKKCFCVQSKEREREKECGKMETITLKYKHNWARTKANCGEVFNLFEEHLIDKIAHLECECVCVCV